MTQAPLNRALLATLCTIACLATISTANAAPITYQFRATGGNGEFNGNQFNDAAFLITVTADTSNIVEFSPGIYDVDGIATIEMPGVTTGTFVTPTRVYSNNLVPGAGFSRSRTIGGSDLLDLDEPAFAGYALTAPFGPVFEDTPLAVDQFSNVQLDTGMLSFFSVDTVTFVALPEPMTAALLGLGGLFIRRRR